MRTKGFFLALTLALGLPMGLGAQEADKMFRLAAPAALQDSGLLKYLVPRFSLKTATRITIVPGDDADAVLGTGGQDVFAGLGQTWGLTVNGDPDAQRFAEWLRSDIGRNTVDGFMVEGVAPFTSEVKKAAKVVAVSYDGDADLGADLSLEHCGRCHVVGDVNRLNSIGSTPSFAVLRGFADWDDRFAAFYALNPHPAFTQVAEVTPPFDISRPSPIAPVEITLDDLEHIMTFVAAMVPADLGAPIQSR